ncbi:MAG: HAMP domain-containing sensor histidine kinase [Eubacteriaceae bacterium]|nr:HAMP domain-containing sensor histidine kinase [Eubacteriaceae bacterium]
MLKKLQQKFILINMILVGSVMLIGFCTVVVTAYSNQKSDIDRSLTKSVMRMQIDENSAGRPQLGSNGDNDAGNSMATYTVTISKDGQYSGEAQGIAYMSSSMLNSAIKLVYNTDSATSTGKLSSLDLYYKKIYNSDGSMIIAFADSSQIQKNVASTVTYSSLLFVSCMVILFIISYILSKFTIKPVRRAWNQQQQFVADASHELKTPLTVILANNNIILSHRRDSVENQSKWVESSQAEATHMKNLVDNLLYLARSDASKSKPVMSEVNLGEMTMDSALQFEPVAFEKGLDLDYTNIDTSIKIQGDATKLTQLIHILVDNACKYSGKGETVKIDLWKTGTGCSLSVNNRGEPIDPKDLPHIFERFFRSDKARTQQNQEGGYGLGLAIAKSIVDDHNGKISATSTKERGTTFTVEFKSKR